MFLFSAECSVLEEDAAEDGDVTTGGTMIGVIEGDGVSGVTH